MDRAIIARVARDDAPGRPAARGGACYRGYRTAGLHRRSAAPPFSTPCRRRSAPCMALSRGDASGGTVPDSFGKRNREKAKARKAAVREDRRIARRQRGKGIPHVTERDRQESN